MSNYFDHLLLSSRVMLMSELRVVKVRVAGHDVQPDNSHVFQQIGFSPQEDPLWPVITFEEHLECYAELRGIPQSQVETIIRR